MQQKRPRVLSGIQPTGVGSHLGNYLGALRRWVGMQDTHDAFYFVPDLHAITVPQDPATLRRRTREAVAELMACGLDPGRCTIFVQSQIPEHAELAWILSCITGFGEASRMTQFKDKSARKELGSASVGLFNYPILMVADILIYQADQVPVGKDQQQHLELTRVLARRFNTQFGETFTVPAAYAVHDAARIADLQDPDKKMSKSRPVAGTIGVLDDPAVIRKRIRSAVTDTGRDIVADESKPGVTNLLTILSAVTDSTVEQLEKEFDGKGYGDLKDAVADAVVAELAPIQERYHELIAEGTVVDEALTAGAQAARAVASETMLTVRDRVGFLPPVRRS
ncbi:MAG: tryptophan--tRNA ligase [Mycobacteriales bacterium]